jgi:hypothetical protein
MGKVWEWFTVAILGLGWGAFMLFWTVRKRKQAQIKPVLLPSDIFLWALMGIFFGLVSTFHWRAFHWPLLLPTLSSFAIGVLAAGSSSSRKVQSPG